MRDLLKSKIADALDRVLRDADPLVRRDALEGVWDAMVGEGDVEWGYATAGGSDSVVPATEDEVRMAVARYPELTAFRRRRLALASDWEPVTAPRLAPASAHPATQGDQD